MKYHIAFFLFFLFVCSVRAEESAETCRSYVLVGPPENVKFCLRDRDDKIAEYDKTLNEELHRQEFADSLKNDDTPKTETNDN